MDRININNIFHCKATEHDKPLDVYSLYHPEENKINNQDINIEVLIKQQKERKTKIVEKYQKLFEVCLKKIHQENKKNKTDYIFNIPTIIFRCIDYEPEDCLEFIENKLRNNYFDTLILNKTCIFISWIKIEENRNKRNRNTKDYGINDEKIDNHRL